MRDAHYQLGLPEDRRGKLAFAWLIMAVMALFVSGLLVILIIASRTPVVEALFPLKNFFHLAIVVHVDFSVLVWFGCFGAMLWTLISRPALTARGWAGLVIVAAGSALLIIAPFREGAHYMSNYIPVVDNVFFLAGIVVFGLGIVISAAQVLFYPQRGARPGNGEYVLRLGIYTAVIALIMSAVAFFWSFARMPEYLTGSEFYEVLFWGGGHILQFAWTQLMLVTWLWLAHAAGIPVLLSPRILVALLLAGIVPAVLFPWGYLAHEIGSHAHRDFFLWLMAAGGGLAAGPIGLALLLGQWRNAGGRDLYTRGLRASVMFSVVLFGTGGVLGFLIDESNTMIPAHYHGCIVAITLAFMTLALHLVPQFGYGRANARAMLALPWVYGTGQIMHIAGLAVSGGHGVQRKTAGADQGLEGWVQIAGMSVMGLGGLIAIIGGMIFLVTFFKALRGTRPDQRMGRVRAPASSVG